MRNFHLGCMVVADLLMGVALGCHPEAESAKPPVVTEKQTPSTQETLATKEPPAPAKPTEPTPPPLVPPSEPAPPPTIPIVTLDAANAATCLVKVDDLMPDGQLSDLDGQTQSVVSLRGKTLTVIYFWKSENLYGLEGLKELASELTEPYNAKGVRLIAVNVGDSPEIIRQKVQSAGRGFVTLLDSHGDYFRKVATEKLPRVYLLDAQGKILWFDLEYSRSVRRDLKQAIQAVLGEK